MVGRYCKAWLDPLNVRNIARNSVSLVKSLMLRLCHVLNIVLSPMPPTFSIVTSRLLDHYPLSPSKQIRPRIHIAVQQFDVPREFPDCPTQNQNGMLSH